MMRARTSELSRYGCYVDTINPLPLDTRVRIMITHEGKEFRAEGRVIYDLPNMGMGVAFLEMAAQHQEVLDHWLRGLEKA